MKKFIFIFLSCILFFSCSDDKNTIQGIWKNSFTTETEFFLENDENQSINFYYTDIFLEIKFENDKYIKKVTKTLKDIHFEINDDVQIESITNNLKSFINGDEIDEGFFSIEKNIFDKKLVLKSQNQSEEIEIPFYFSDDNSSLIFILEGNQEILLKK